MTFTPHGLATGIGSLSFSDPALAARQVLENFPDLPFWPQLPKRAYLENMYVQFSHRLAGVQVDSEQRRIHIDTSQDLSEDLAAGLQQVIDKNYSYFALTPEYAAGYFTFLEEAKKKGSFKYVKGQVTGPISFGLTVNDEKGKAILYHAEYSEYLTQVLAAIAAGQAQELKKLAPVIIFIDEPYLVSVGSAFVNISQEGVINRINTVCDFIHQEEALAGVHCCGNTDWSILTETNLDIINLDSFNFSDSVMLYPEAINKFITRGGVLAWGAVPTSEKSRNLKAEDLFKKLTKDIDGLAKKGIDKKRLIEQSLITPSCGMGTLPEDLTERIIKLTSEVSELFINNA